MNLPEAFQASISSKFEDGEALLAALSNQPSISVFIHPKKSFGIEQKQINGVDVTDAVEWNTGGKYLSERPAYVEDPLYHAGVYYPQEASSMFVKQAIDLVVNEVENPAILDLCAAPGGKSLQVLSALDHRGVLVSNEIVKKRVGPLVENITKWGYTNSIVTNSSADKIGAVTDAFDCILVDAPCSGEGMFRKDPNAVEHWSEEAVLECAARQQSILGDVLPSLKPGGYLIYSTCTFNDAENDEIIKELVQDQFELLDLKITETSAITQEKLAGGGEGKVYRFLPHQVKGEGLFMAVLKKKGTAEMHADKKSFRINKRASRDILQFVEREFSNCQLLNIENKLILRSSQLEELHQKLSSVYQIKAGLEVGIEKGKDLIPSHDLALSLALSAQVNRIELDKKQALKYLKKDTITIPEAEKGWAVVCFKGLPLGWVKVLDNRINNYLPKSFRIRKELSFE